MTKFFRTSHLAIAVLVSMGLAGCGDSNPVTNFTGGGESTELKPTDMVHGAATAPVTIIEYASMTCPHCAAFAKDVMPSLNKDYVETGKVKVVFREFPLDGAARMASAVARCLSGDQYFSFIDLLFANQMNWIKDFDNNSQVTREDVLEGLTQQGRVAGLSREKVQMCAEDQANLALVDGNWMEGQTKYMVNSTPTFIINGSNHSGVPDYESLKKIIDPLLN
jgi:protein-disulfide isomerase